MEFLGNHRRWELWRKHPVCYVCKMEIHNYEESSIEHVIPKSKGGTDHKKNLSISHRKCNELKGSLICLLEWKIKLQRDILEIKDISSWQRSLSSKYAIHIVRMAIWGHSELRYEIDIAIDYIPQWLPDYRRAVHEKFEFLRTLETNDLELQSPEASQETNNWNLLLSLIYLERFLKHPQNEHELSLAINKFELFLRTDPKGYLRIAVCSLIAFSKRVQIR